MFKTMYENHGVGLAAPQIGKSDQLIVIDTGDNPLSFINPQIVWKSKETVISEEGCLSLPGIYLKIKRAREIEVEAFRVSDGKKVRFRVDGLLANVFQHEIDHLNGALIIDRVPFPVLKRFTLRKQLEKIKYMSRKKIQGMRMIEEPKKEAIINIEEPKKEEPKKQEPATEQQSENRK